MLHHKRNHQTAERMQSDHTDGDFIVALKVERSVLIRFSVVCKLSEKIEQIDSELGTDD